MILVALGAGDKPYEEMFQRLSKQFPNKIAVKVAYDNAIAHKIEAGADMFLMPSRYEPSGLNQIYSLKYGTIPIVRATGGLKDSVEEFDSVSKTGTGFLFGPYDTSSLRIAVDRALGVFPQKSDWNTLIRNAMAADFSWDRSARAYLEVYNELLGVTAANQ